MGILFDHWNTDEFKDWKYSHEYLRPCRHSIEERIINACHFRAKKGHHPASLVIKESRAIEFIQTMGSRAGFTLHTAHGLTRLLIK